MEYFITFTYANGLTAEHVDAIKMWHEEKCEKFFVVNEHGKGGNSHIHSYAKLSKAMETDNLNKSVRKYVYTKDDIKTMKQLVVVKKVISLQSTYNYMTKEPGYKTITSNLDETDLKKGKIHSKTYITGKIVCSYLTFPYQYIEYCDLNELAITNYQSNVRHMLLNGYVVHHLFRRMKECICAIEMLTQKDYSNHFNEIFL